MHVLLRVVWKSTLLQAASSWTPLIMASSAVSLWEFLVYYNTKALSKPERNLIFFIHMNNYAYYMDLTTIKMSNKCLCTFLLILNTHKDNVCPAKCKTNFHPDFVWSLTSVWLKQKREKTNDSFSLFLTFHAVCKSTYIFHLERIKKSMSNLQCVHSLQNKYVGRGTSVLTLKSDTNH